MLKVCFALTLMLGAVFSCQLNAADAATEPVAPAVKAVEVPLKITGMT